MHKRAMAYHADTIVRDELSLHSSR